MQPLDLGTGAWQIVAQWTWNLRLELGHILAPEPVRTTEFAPAAPASTELTSSGYGKPSVATAFKAGRFSGQDSALQLDGTLRCPADQKLLAHEHRREADGSLRVVYGASICSCRPYPLLEQCQWSGSATAKPRQVSVLLHPLAVNSVPLLWRDWHRRHQRYACLRLHRQHLEVLMEPVRPRAVASSPPTISRAERAHYRLSWAERLARNARTDQADRIMLTLFGIPASLATFLGLAAA